MINILREFSFGNLNPNECPFKKSSEYSRALNAFVDAEEKMAAALNESEKALYEQYATA